jgi:hypothetical protein
MFPIEMKHIGKIEVVGTVQVFGYSAKRVDEHVSDMIYLNYAGPATAAASVWANLIERRALDFTDLAGKPHRLRHSGYPGLEGNEAPFKRFITRIEHLAVDHCILLDRRFFEPSYDFETSLAFVFEGQNMADKIGHHVSQSVDIAMFPEWHAALAALGKREGLVTPLTNHGGHSVWQVTLDRSRWTTLISAAVGRGDLAWPGKPQREIVVDDLPMVDIPPIAFDKPIAVENGKPIPALDVESEQPIYTVSYDPPWTVVAFSGKPVEATRERLKSAGFRWDTRRYAWRTSGHLAEVEVEKVVGYLAGQKPS